MNRLVIKGILALFVVYFPIALYLKFSYVPLPETRQKIWLTGPFIRLDGVAYVAFLPRYDSLADSLDKPFTSDLVLYENEQSIGPPHSEHSEIISLGMGRYSHWKGQGLIFSASDNSDPNQNWKRYSVKIEPPRP